MLMAAKAARKPARNPAKQYHTFFQTAPAGAFSSLPYQNTARIRTASRMFGTRTATFSPRQIPARKRSPFRFQISPRNSRMQQARNRK